MTTRRPGALFVTPSVLDRLLDDAPNVERDGARERQQDLRGLRASVARDLEALLNTRRASIEPVPDALAHVRRSIVDYGIPDFTSRGLANPDDREAVRRSVEHAIATHESRLRQVRVAMEPAGAGQRELRFRVEAILEVAPAREPVRFDAMLQVTTQQYTVRSGE